MKTLVIAILTAALTGLAGTVQAATPNQLRDAFIDRMATEHGFDRTAVRRTLYQARVRKPILEAIARPAEKRLTWGQYRRIFLKPARIDGGVAYWKENADTLRRAEQTHGVPPEIVVAIIGVETLYGRHTGTYPVLDALTTLGFHYPKRGKFFRSELSHFLRLVREEGVQATEPMGSYAGAMGRPQFISSSYRAYAVDFDGDGKRDIWHNDADVIGSVANYFARHGWTPGQPVTTRVNGLQAAQRALIDKGLKAPHTPVSAFIASGLQPADTVPVGLKASLIELEGSAGPEHWLSLPNFYTITRYNHSPLYAMAVYQLSEEIRRAHADG
jgi:membrane-bound lytic murein transglycosylase B